MKLSSSPFRQLSSVLGLSLLLAAGPEVKAATPQLFNFQAVARRPDGAPIASTAVKIRATIHQTSASGTVVYQETQSTTTSAGGQIALQIGAGTILSGSLSLIQWQNSNFYLQIEIDPANGNTFTDMGSQQMVAVPYAFQSRISDYTSAISGSADRIAMFGAAGNTVVDSSIYYSNGYIGIGDSTPEYVLDVNGTVRGLTVRSQGSVIATGAVQGNTGAFTTAVTVGGAGILRSVDSTQLRVYTRDANFYGTLGAGSTIDGAIGYFTFNSPPKVIVGGISSGTGDFAKVTLTLFDITASSCKARFYNPGSSSVTFNANWQIICIGN